MWHHRIDLIYHFVRCRQMSDNTVCPSKFLAFLLKILFLKKKPEIEVRQVSFNCFAIYSLSNKEQQGVHHHWQQLLTINLSIYQNCSLSPGFWQSFILNKFNRGLQRLYTGTCIILQKTINGFLCLLIVFLKSKTYQLILKDVIKLNRNLW